jgi:hypothetical protein
VGDQERIEEDQEGEVHNRVHSSCGVGQGHCYACIQGLDTEVVVHSNVLGMVAEGLDHKHNGYSDLDSLLEVVHELEEAHCCTLVRMLGHDGDPHCDVGAEEAAECAAGSANS